MADFSTPLTSTTEGAEGETAIDLYAGVGLLSLPLARRFREVTAVESGAGAVRDLQFNAARAGLENLHAMPQTAEEHLAQLEKAPDFVVLDQDLMTVAPEAWMSRPRRRSFVPPTAIRPTKTT